MPAAINTPFFSSSRSKIGVKPMGFPPIYQPNTVADVVLYAAEHPTREVVAGGAGKAMLLTQRISPRLMDALMLLAGTLKRPTSRNPRMIPTTSARLYMKTESKETLVTGRIREVFTIG